MAKYMSREDAQKIICDWCGVCQNPTLEDLEKCDDICPQFARTPTADVRAVVLCRDCKRYGGRPWENNESGICARTDVGVGEFDFCSYGEKREES